MGGGYGTRLYPVTFNISKHLLPVYDKPMIYYSLSLPLLAKIRDILFVADERAIESYKRLFGDGSRLGIKIEYLIQDAPNGIAEGLVISDSYIGDDNIMMVLGDNVVYGERLSDILKNSKNIVETQGGSVAFAYEVSDPRRYGVIEFDKNGKALSIEEKPKAPKSNFAIPGIYFFDNEAISIAKSLKPSDRGELEITDVLKEYMKEGKLKVEILSRGIAWLDTGTFDSLLDASLFIKTLQERTGLMIGNIEEIVWRNGWIDDNILIDFANSIKKTQYGQYLINLVNRKLY